MIESNVGFVYLLASEHELMVKVGWSKKPWERHAQIATQNPGIKLIAFFPGSRKVEATFHRMFKRNRVKESREWLRFSRKKCNDFLTVFLSSAYLNSLFSGIPTVICDELGPKLIDLYLYLDKAALEVAYGPSI